ncbi:MAG TPA: hypothetical protein VLX91_04260 [Candidatus Acidoferrales bacterium]|nr:hypothetical protein [Candidatus Acidoferrales bacterium]
MFNDARSKKIVVTAHCLLNQNSISDGTADMPSQFDTIVNLLITNKVGIIQLPCPEFLCLGLARRDEGGANRELLAENTRIRALMREERNKEILIKKAQEIAEQLRDYQKYHFKILGLIGINRSPSCGVDTTTLDGREMEGHGVFMEILEGELSRKKIRLNMVGVKTNREEESIEKVRNLLEE